MTTPEEKERKLRRLRRNEAAKALQKFKPKRVENKKKMDKYTPPEYDIRFDYAESTDDQ